MKNWIEDRNPFRLDSPPTWWLKQLRDIDPALRVFPGLSNYCYVVGRWSTNAQYFRFLTKVTRFNARDNRAEAQRLLRHGCVFVKTLTVFDVLNDSFFGWLRHTDSWNPLNRAASSIDVAIDHTIDAIEAAEDRAEAKANAQMDDEALMRGSSAYTAMLLRRGNMTFVHDDMKT